MYVHCASYFYKFCKKCIYCNTIAFNCILFIGSSSGLELVRSICRQIHFTLGHNLNESLHLLSAAYEECVSELHTLIAGTFNIFVARYCTVSLFVLTFRSRGGIIYC